ncbi:hypothetical protein AAVH_26100 [Aphelenchoides avenae]|nr:hypothetical protein AAVH_26100 [Aphelenchus avenae]
MANLSCFSTAIVRLAELASDVYGFHNRVHAGTSLVANRSLYEMLCSLAQRLPVHHLICEFERDRYQGGCRRFWSGFYWFTLTHLQLHLLYDDERLFKMPSSAAAADSALICRYLSNSHMARLLVPNDSVLYLYSRDETEETLREEYRFAIRMLASIATRNFSVGYLRLFAGDDPLTDYRSMDVVLGGMSIEVLDLWASEDRFVNLVKTTDFFHLRTIQRLRELRLELWITSGKPPKARSRCPIWTAGITQLSECSYYEVDYRTHQSIHRPTDRPSTSVDRT